ncbi:universal stress protein [Chloroflexota bacterium]
MFKKILVPLDGSELSELALPYAEELAGALNSEVTLLFVCDTANCQYRPQHQAYIEKVSELLKDHIGGEGAKITVKALIVEGYPADEIINYAAENDISVTIMATHGRTGIMSWAIGSVANKVLRGVGTPVLLIRANIPAPEVVGKEQLLSRILVPLDGSKAGEAMLPHVKELTRKLKSEITFLQVVEPGQHVHTVGGLNYVPFHEQELENLKAHAREYLDGVSSQFADTDDIIKVELKSGDTASEIIKFADETNTHLVTMSTHGHAGIGRWELGSIAHKVLHHGNTPLLLVRTPTARAK